jgi:hypothetical protein
MTHASRSLVLSINVSGIDFDWQKDRDCLIEIGSLKDFAVAKASQIREYVSSLRLLNDFHVWVRIVEDEVKIEVTTDYHNFELFKADTELKNLQTRIHENYILHKSSLVMDQNDGDKKSELKSDHEQKKLLAKFLSGSTNAKMNIDFGHPGSEVADLQKIKLTDTKVVDENSSVIVVGKVRYYDEELQKVKLHRLQRMNGYITLDVFDSSMRKTLLVAQTEQSDVELKYSPSIISSISDRQLPKGVLSEIISVATGEKWQQGELN